MSKKIPKIEALVVGAIRELQSAQGSTTKEITNYLAQQFDFVGPEFRKQIQLTIKRGLNYGILQRSKRGYVTCDRSYIPKPVEQIEGPECIGCQRSACYGRGRGRSMRSGRKARRSRSSRRRLSSRRRHRSRRSRSRRGRRHRSMRRHAAFSKRSGRRRAMGMGGGKRVPIKRVRRSKKNMNEDNRNMGNQNSNVNRSKTTKLPASREKQPEQ